MVKEKSEFHHSGGCEMSLRNPLAPCLGIADIQRNLSAGTLSDQGFRQTRSMRCCSFIAFVLPAILMFGPLNRLIAADGADKYIVPIKAMAATPKIDGKLDDQVWSAAPVLTDFTQFEPKEGVPASEKTVVKVGYDETNIYIGIRCFDSHPDQQVVKQLQRDGDLTFDDFVEIILDTYHDRRNGFLFAVNALGAKYDALVRNEGEEIKQEWDGQWECATARDDQGWTAELAIPFRTLRFPTTEPQSWGINIMRFMPRTSEKSFWRAFARTDGSNVRYKISKFGELTGLENLKSGRRYLMTPHVMGVAESDAHRPENPALNGGIDLKANLASNLVADLTYRLDFAEAEADLQQINLSRYPLDLPEKRAFFNEGSDMFYFGDRPEPFELGQVEKFYFFRSRQIGLTDDGRYAIPVIGGAKVTGKLGDYTVGFLNLTTDSAVIKSIGAQDQLDVPRTNYTVLRLRKDIYARSKIGFIALNKDASGSNYNRGFGADGDFAFGEHFAASGFLATTSTPGVHGQNNAGAIDTIWDSKAFRFRNMYEEVGNNFNPEMGYLARDGIKKFHSQVFMARRPTLWGLHKVNIIGDFNYVTDQQGRLLTQTEVYELGLIHKGYAGVAFIFYDHLERLDLPKTVRLDSFHAPVIPIGLYRFRNFFIGGATDRRKPLSATIWFDQGGYYNGTRFRFLIQPIYRPIDRVEMAMVFDRQAFDFPDGHYTTIQMSGSLALTLPHEMSVKTLLQWTRDDIFAANVVFNWDFKPDATFYLVYNGTREVGDLIVNDRSFVAKMSYNFSH